MQSRFSTAIHEFFRWWGGELSALLPRQALFSGKRHGPRRLVLSVEGPRLRLLLEKSGKTELLGEAAQAGDAGLSDIVRIARESPGLPLGLRVGGSACFTRGLELPARAEADFARMLDLDMERTTPFRAADVLTAHYIVPGSAAPRGKRAVRHLVVKRKTLDPLLSDLRAFGIEPAFADCWSEDGRSGLPVDFLAARQVRNWRSGFLSTMAGLAVVLAISAIAILFGRHQGALEDLKARTATASREAAIVRLAVEASQTAGTQIAAMQSLQRKRVPLAGIIEELTAIMPDSAWVSDLRIDGDMIEFTGFAKSAASLVPLLENSPLFAQASLTSPVTLDSHEDKERFSMRLRLSQETAAATEAATTSKAAYE